MGRYDHAIREFTAGYALSPRPQFLLNIAQAQRRLGDLRAARDMYHKYLDALPDAPEREQIGRILQELDEAIAKEPPPPPPGVAAGLTAPPRPRLNARAYQIGGGATLGVGLLGIVLGGTFAGLARNVWGEIHTSTAFDPNLESRLSLYQNLEAAFLVIGGVATITGAVVMGIGVHSARHAVTVRAGLGQVRIDGTF
jgi:hypothetical protein